MLLTIRRAAFKRTGVTAGQCSGRAGWQLPRVCNTENPSHVSRPNCSANPRFTILLKRTYATNATAKPSTKSRARTAPTTKVKTTTRAASRTTKKAAKPKKVAKKKAAVKAKPKKKVLTEKQKLARVAAKAKADLKELKAVALLDSPKQLPFTAWQVLLQETFKDKKSELGKDGIGSLATGAALSYKSLDASTREHYNHLANQNKIANEKAYKEWVESHTPDQIRAANAARLRLKRLGKSRSGSSKYSVIHDSRIPKRPRTARIVFQTERYESGDMKGIPFKDASTTLQKEWTDMSTSDRQHFEDVADAERRRYAVEYKTVFHRDMPTKLKASASA